MGSICERDGRFKASIRKKDKKLFSIFSSRDLAEIWIRYHEDLIDNMENFNVPAENIITLEQCFELKIEDLKQKNVQKKTLEDFDNCLIEFKEIMNCPLGEITSDMIRDISKEMLGSVVRRGGSAKYNTGSLRVCSPATVLRKLRIIASVFSFMIEKGANITNVAQIVCNQVKMSIIKTENDDDINE